ncbi:hypothetical protein F7725_016712, partial [Dissostichus mawsoni]
MLGLKGQEDSSSEEELGCGSEPDRLCFCIRFGKLFSPELRSQGDSGVCGVWEHATNDSQRRPMFWKWFYQDGDSHFKGAIQSLQEEKDQYEKLTSQQKDQLVSLEREITGSENTIQEKLTVPGGLFKLKGKQSRHWKHIRSLENHLNQ